MDLQNLLPQQAQPISRITNGQLPTELAELTEEVLGDSRKGTNVLPSDNGWLSCVAGLCSYEGDDAE